MAGHGLRRFATAAAATAVMIAGVGLTTAPAQAARDGKVVARKDIDGDGRKDTVRFRRLRPDGIEVTVQTANGRTVHKRVPTPGFIQERWHGATRIDGRRGAEIVVLTDAGAHSLFFTVLTWRGGKLAVERAPGHGDSTWYTDGAVWISAGYKRLVRHNRVSIVSRLVTRSLPHGAWKGRAVTYRWQHGRWHRRNARTIRPGTRAAYEMGGWHVKGLPHWPSW